MLVSVACITVRLTAWTGPSPMGPEILRPIFDKTLFNNNMERSLRKLNPVSLIIKEGAKK